MSAVTCIETASPTPRRSSKRNRHLVGLPTAYDPTGRRRGRGHVEDDRFVVNALDHVARLAPWDRWSELEPVLGTYADLSELRAACERREPGSYAALAALTRLGSSRRGNVPEAGLAVVVLLHPGLVGLSHSLAHTGRTLDDLRSVLWMEVQSAEPQIDHLAARFLLHRVRQRVVREHEARRRTAREVSFEALVEAYGGEPADIGPGAVLDDESELPARAELLRFMEWCEQHKWITADQLGLAIELIKPGLSVKAAEEKVAAHHCVGVRTVRRWKRAIVDQLRSAAGDYTEAALWS